MSTNCWEFKKCGPQPGGSSVAELGVSRAAAEAKANGLNGGRNGGRICRALAGTLCGGKLQGTFARKLASCLACEFYKMVYKEQGANLKTLPY